MSIALESNASDHHRNGRSRFGHGVPFAVGIYGSDDPRMFGPPDGDHPRTKGVEGELDDDGSGSESSSIGRNSDDSSDDRDGGEVQSERKDGALESMEAMEDALPVKKGISNFYQGKSKSFTTLADAVHCSSIKDIVKPENAYSKRRRSLLAYSNLSREKNRNLPPRNNSSGISKRLTNCSRSSFALAFAMNGDSSDNSENCNSNSSSPSRCPPPRPPHSRKSPGDESSSVSTTTRQNFSPWRSFSLSDLQCAAATSSTPAGRNC